MLFLNTNVTCAQHKNSLLLQIYPKTVETLAAEFRLKNNYADSLQLKNSLAQFIAKLHAEGYLLANLDQLIYKKEQQSFSAIIHLGQHYTGVYIKQGNVDRVLWERFTTKQGLTSIGNWQLFRENLIRYAENNGYPFASIQLNEVEIDTTELSASINFQTGPLIQFDSLIIEGETRLNAAFLAHYLGWHIGKPYHEQKATDAIARLQQLPYLKLKTDPQRFFKYDRAYLKLVVLPLKNTQLDGIIGVLLNNQSGANRQPIITGALDLKLQSPFGKGKLIQFSFQRLRLGAQLFDLHYEHPNLLKTNLTLQGNFYSLREDSLFNNLRRSIALQHQASWGKLAFKARIIDSRLTFSSQQLTLDNLQQFGSNKVTAYGLQYDYQRLDNRISPRKGTKLVVDLSAGNKVIRPSVEASDPLFETVYGAINLKSLQVNAYFDGSQFWKVGEQSTLLTRLQVGKLWSDRLYQNDLFRLGGITTLRGFNENTFFASSYAIASLEYRIYVANQSYFLVFADQGYLNNEVQGFEFEDFPIGFGMGLAIQTKGGLFKLIYSLGNAEEQPLGFQQAKIHFGLTSFL